MELLVKAGSEFPRQNYLPKCLPNLRRIGRLTALPAEVNCLKPKGPTRSPEPPEQKVGRSNRPGVPFFFSSEAFRFPARNPLVRVAAAEIPLFLEHNMWDRQNC